jgi:hypothetical protein
MTSEVVVHFAVEWGAPMMCGAGKAGDDGIRWSKSVTWDTPVFEGDDSPGRITCEPCMTALRRSPQPSKAEERNAGLEEGRRKGLREAAQTANDYSEQMRAEAEKAGEEGDERRDSILQHKASSGRALATRILGLIVTQPGVPEGGAPSEPWGPRIRLLLAQAWKRNDERGAYGMLDVLTAGMEQLAKDMERASAPPAPPAPHPEVVDRSLVDELTRALRLAHREHFSTPQSTCHVCALLALSSSPPSLLRTAEQEREAVVSHYRRCEEACRRMVGVAEGALAKGMWLAQAEQHASVADAISRGDHLQTPGSDPKGGG